jgi:hypothetical protein
MAVPDCAWKNRDMCEGGNMLVIEDT